MTDKVIGEIKNRIWLFLFILIWCVQMLTAVYFCCQKKGFHEDEYYTYYSTARTYGLALEDNAWMEHDAYFNEFVVLEDQGFRYGLVKQVQSWDVHPPFYYWVFHTLASLFPETFSKWYGLAINLAAFGLSMFLLWWLSLKVTENNERLSLLVCFFYGFTPAAMSGVVFIRMYALLTVFILLCAILHVNFIVSRGGREGEADRLPFVKFLLPLMIMTYFGFLTQYYYFIFLFFMAAAFCVYLLWTERKLQNCIRYAVSLAITFILAYLTYPAYPGQMFKGQRGAQAAGNFFDISNTFARIKFFAALLNEYVFGKALPVLAAVIIVLILYLLIRRKRYNIQREDVKESKNIRKNVYLILLFTTAGYFFAVSKTALLLGNTSIRYQLPIYGITVLLVFTALEGLGRACCESPVNKKLYDGLLIAAAFISLLINLSGFISGRVVFLYPEDEMQIAFAREQAQHGTPVVCIYDEGQGWCVWDMADEFFEYDRVYFTGQGNTAPITDPYIAGSDSLILYLSHTADADIQLGRIQESMGASLQYELKHHDKYYDVYYFNN